MLEIRTMKAKDFRPVLRLTNEEHWGFGVRDLERMLALEPRGCLVAVVDNRPIGLTTSISYGRRLGWIGNVVVHRKHRGAGIGTALVEAAIQHLERSRVKSIGLNSYPRNKPTYERLGFKPTSGFVRLSISRVTHPPRAGTNHVPLALIVRLDRRLFGADRARLLKRLLAEFPRTWTWLVSGSDVSAYSIVKQYQDSSEIGPAVSREMSQQRVDALLRSSIAQARRLPLEVSVPESSHVALETAAQLGFIREKAGLVMSLRGLEEVHVGPAVVAFGFLDKG